MKESIKIIPKEEFEKALKALDRAEKDCQEEDLTNINFQEVKEYILTLEGKSTSTVVGIVTTALLLLPTGAVLAVLDNGKKIFSAKAMIDLSKALSQKENSESSEEPNTSEEQND